MILSTRLTNKKRVARRRSTACSLGASRTQRPRSSGGQATSYDRSDRWFNTTTDRDFIDDYPIIRVSSHWDLNNEAWRISNREVVNSSNKYSTINRSTTIKSGSSSSSRTPLQSILQHSPTAEANLWDKSELTLQNQCALSDQQATCHQLRRNLFKPNQQGTTSSNEAAWYLHPQQKSEILLPAVIAFMYESNRQINFNSLKKSETSLPAAIAIKTSPITGSVLDDFKKSTTLLQIYTLAQPSSPRWWDGFIRLQRSFQIIKHLADLSLSLWRLTQ
jgi:hypothetical protein